METILLVDDDLMVLDAVGTMLEHLKHTVWKMGNAKDALAILRDGRQTFDLVIVDLVLKGSSGLDLVHQIRAARPSLPIIAISGYISDQSLAAAGSLLTMGITQVLTKPIAMADLEGAVMAATGRRRL